MRPDRTLSSYNLNLLEVPLSQFINTSHELVILSDRINWGKLEDVFGKYYADVGRKGVQTRLILGLVILQYTYNLSDEGVCARWVENPYFQYFCGEKFFCHKLPINRTNLTKWRKRVGAEELDKVLQETLAQAHCLGALTVEDVKKVVVDTTVQTKAVDYPSESKLLLDAILDLGRQAKKGGLKLKQNYRFVAKELAAKISGYAHARQMKRVKTGVKQLRRVLFKLRKRIEGSLLQSGISASHQLTEKMERSLKVLTQEYKGSNQLLVWHAPEVECISKGKARDRYEFGVKVSIATTINRARGGHFILSSSAIQGRPYDGHTLKETIEQVESITGVDIDRIYVDKGYRGHNYEHPHKVFRSGQKRGVFGQIKRELRRRSAIEPIIGHAKMSHKLDRHRLKGMLGDKINAIYSAIGFNFRQLLNWIKQSLLFLLYLIRIFFIKPPKTAHC